jgi:hypothetical protein
MVVIAATIFVLMIASTALLIHRLLTLTTASTHCGTNGTTNGSAQNRATLAAHCLADTGTNTATNRTTQNCIVLIRISTSHHQQQQ